jgi:Domain of unknown function (DUF4375)
MDTPEQGFLVVLEFEDDDRPLIIEDDGRVCHAHVRGPTGNVVSAVWLYNRLRAPDEAGSESLARTAPLNPRTHALDWGDKPFPSSEAEFSASICKSTNSPTVFSIFIRDELFAILRVGESIGMSKLAKKDGPFGLRLPRSGEAYWQVVSPYWERVDIYSGGDAFLRTFANVPEPAGHLLALHWCQSEVCNGGFHQFFTNSTGVLAPEAAQGFRAINMSAIAEILERAMAVFGTPYPRAQEMRHQFLPSVPGGTRDEWDPFIALDDAFYEAKGDDVLYDAADAYAVRTMPREARLNLTPEPRVGGTVCYVRLG